MSFEDLLRAAFPIQTELFALELVESTTDYDTGATVPGIHVHPDGSTIAVIRLFAYEMIGGKRQVRDIKEQHVVLLKAKHRNDPRIDAYITGWREAVLAVFESQEALMKRDRAAFEKLKHSIATLMPHDLCKPELLDLKRPRDAAAFTDALLSTRRFGPFMA
jgi:hypothetical protein